MNGTSREFAHKYETYRCQPRKGTKEANWQQLLVMKLSLQTLEYFEGVHFSCLRALAHSFPCSTFFGKEKSFHQSTLGGCCNRLHSTVQPLCHIKWPTVLSKFFFALLHLYTVTHKLSPQRVYSVKSVHCSSGQDEERDGCLGTVTCVVPIAWNFFHETLNNPSLYFYCHFLHNQSSTSRRMIRFHSILITTLYLISIARRQ